MKKKSTYLLALAVGVIFICIGIFDIVRDSQNQRSDDLKSITIEIIDEVNDEVLLQETFQTTSEDLGGFLKTEPKVALIYEDDQYGLYITSLMGREASASAFWLFESSNNKSCAADTSGYCPAADSVILQDGDSFTFQLSDDFS